MTTVQRGSFDFGATEDSDTVTLSTSVATARAFAKVTGVRFASGGPAAGTTSDKSNDDLGVTCLLTATDTITFTRQSSGVNEDVRVYWEVWEFPTTGNHAAIVRYHDNVTIANTSLQQDQTVSGVSTLADCVPFVCGISSADTNADWETASVRAEMVNASGNKVRLTRNDSIGAVTVSVAVVEFTGSSWILETNISHTFGTSGANETKAITDILDTTHAFIVSSMSQWGPNGDDLGYNVWFKDSNELYFRLENSAGQPNEHIAIAHVIRNDSLTVEHLDSITGGKSAHPDGSASPQSYTTTITTVDAMGQTSLVATSDDFDSGNNYPRPFWQYRLTDTDEVTWWRGRYGTYGAWALQVVQWPEEATTRDSEAFFCLC